MPRAELHTSIEIAAEAAAVWDVLTDFAAYPEWNPFVTEISGEAAAGSRLRVRLVPPGRRGMTLRPTVLDATPGSTLRWLGRFLVPRFFDGEHLFRIEPVDAGHVRFVQAETFRGLLVPLVWRSLEGPTREGFEAMNRALAERVATVHAR